MATESNIANYRAVVRNLQELSREDWERLNHPSFYLSYNWLATRSSVIRGTMHFLLVYNRWEQPLLGFPFYTITESSHKGYDPVELLLRSYWKEISPYATEADLQAVQQLASILQQQKWSLRPAMVAALPSRSGGISYSEDLSRDTAVRALEEAVVTMETVALDAKAPVSAWLYVRDASDPSLHQVLTGHGYVPLTMDAESYMPIHWHTFEDYLQHLTSHHRRTVRREIADFRETGCTIELCGADVLTRDLAELEIQWRAKYGGNTSAADLEKQYQLIKENLSPNVVVFVAKLQGQVIGFAVFFEYAGVWYSRFGGFDYGAGKRFTYFNLLFYAPIREAIHRGIRSIRYSTGAHNTKRLRGCQLANLLMYVRFPPELASVIEPGLKSLDRLCRMYFQRVATSHGKQSLPPE